MIDLKAWRTGRGMTQQQAADALGIGNSTVRAIEAGTREMTATLSLACHGWDATATANAPAPDGEQPAGSDDVLALQQAVDDICARLTTLEAAAVFNKKWQDAGNKAFEQLGHRVQMIELRAGKAAPSLSESDIGMIARRAARSVLPD